MMEATTTRTDLQASEACCDETYTVPATGRACCGEAELGANTDQRVKEQVRAFYAERATTGTSCCGGGCGCGTTSDAERIGTSVGYTPEELAAAPEGSNLGLGCGNPTAMDEIQPGATVLDLGSGAGIDCFLAAQKVGPEGRVIGVDMTPEMIARAQENAHRVGAENVEFRLGEIEALPVADESVDVVISNCVINLSPNKPQVFREAYRVLKPGGRLMVSDLVLTRLLPEYIRSSVSAYAACIAGAELKYRYLSYLEEAGFTRLTVAAEDDYLAAVGEEAVLDWVPDERRAETQALLADGSPVASLKVMAVKP